jgi:pilus assembly protein Flp/PilA
MIAMARSKATPGTWKRAFRAFIQDDAGATSIEYALMAVFIATVIIGSVSLLGARLSQIFATTSTAF